LNNQANKRGKIFQRGNIGKQVDSIFKRIESEYWKNLGNEVPWSKDPNRVGNRESCGISV